MVLLGLLIGARVYSYGMFHTERPTLSEFTRAADCGYPSATTCEHNISTELVLQEIDRLTMDRADFGFRAPG